MERSLNYRDFYLSKFLIKRNLTNENFIKILYAYNTKN